MTEGIYQAVVSAPGFSIGVRCDEAEIHTIEYLEPRTEVVPSNALAREAARQLQAYLADPDFVFTLPLRPSGTAFQRRVREQISAIPTHQTRTYGELAKALHNAPRAAGQACGDGRASAPVPAPARRSVPSRDRGRRRPGGLCAPARRFPARRQALAARP